jgi:hypothetical protein
MQQLEGYAGRDVNGVGIVKLIQVIIDTGRLNGQRTNLAVKLGCYRSLPSPVIMVMPSPEPSISTYSTNPNESVSMS